MNPFDRPASKQLSLLGGTTLLTLLMAVSSTVVIAQTAEENTSPETTESTQDGSEKNSDENSLMEQVKLFFHIGDTTRELNMEETGISGLNDTAGQSLGEKQLLALKEKYEQELKKNPQDDTKWAALGSVLETMGEEESALAAYEEAIKNNPDNQAARQGINRYRRSHRILTRIYYSFQHEEEYAPALDRDLATWEEQAMNVQVSKSWGQGKTLALGWLKSTIYQKNELYGDVDFSLKRRAPFVHFSWPLMDNLSMAIRVRDEKFTDDDSSGYYQIDGSEHIITGYLALAWRGDGYWANFNYSREREPDPVIDLASGRSALNIEVKELTGFSGGVALAPAWELGTSLYYEQYGSNREDQLNPNIQLSHWFPGLPGARVSLGYGYYSEEYENITNLTASYQWQPRQDLQFRFEYQLEYSSQEDSLLNQGDILMTWNIIDRLSFVLRADYSQESGGDEDSNFYTQASLNWSFY
jgi:tetratricopeptide (TPR) repeat protein